MLWSVVLDLTPPELCRQAFPPIFFVIQIGGILGSYAAVHISSLGGEVGLMILQMVLLLVTIAFVFVACSLATFRLPEEEPLVPDQSLVNAEAGSRGEATNASDTAARNPEGSNFRAGVAAFYKGMEGLWLLLSRPYVLMLFWVSYANLMPRTVLDYENQVLINDAFPDRASRIVFLGRVNLMINGGVAVVTLLGTRPIVERFGMRASLLALPIAMMACVIGLAADYSLRSSTVALVVSCIIAYGLNSPCKEMLYVRTSREIKYKAKSWSEMYGNQVMKLFGAQINLWVNRRSPACGESCFHPITTVGVVAAWVCLWLGTAATIGQKHAQLEKEDKVVN
jgi:ATP/ADP translocase